jgi:hypothetical protein
MNFKEAMKCTCTSPYNAIGEEHKVSKEHPPPTKIKR